MNDGTFKVPTYWYDLFHGLTDKEVGIVMRCIFAYHSNSLVRQTEATKQLNTVSKEAIKVHDICLEDIRYQERHPRAYRKPENATEIRNSKEYKEWRTAVYERDKYTCQKCGKVGGVLNAHHIKPFSRYPDQRLNIENGITLCKGCHKLAHERGFKNA